MTFSEEESYWESGQLVQYRLQWEEDLQAATTLKHGNNEKSCDQPESMT